MRGRTGIPWRQNCMCKDTKFGGRLVSKKDPNKTSVARVYWVEREQWVCRWREGSLKIRGSRINRIIGVSRKEKFQAGP